jgi:hypothetical protein
MERELVRIPARPWLTVSGLVVVAGLLCLLFAFPWWRPVSCPPDATCVGPFVPTVDLRLFWTGTALVPLGLYGGLVVALDRWLRRRRTVEA